MRVTALTGAGISTESGIPDYRGPSGLWHRYPDHQKLVTYDYYMADPRIRRRSWMYRRDSPVWSAEPSAGHLALSGLAASGIDVWIVTQNVDGLHQRAGSPPERVLELHGNMFVTVCTRCGDRGTTRDALDRLSAGDDDPACLRCGGILKTGTVMFGEILDPLILDRAVRATEECDVFVAIGTSLQVQPAASLVGLAVEGGARLVIVNGEPTPYDALADEVIRGPIGEALPRLADRLRTA